MRLSMKASSNVLIYVFELYLQGKRRDSFNLI